MVVTVMAKELNKYYSYNTIKSHCVNHFKNIDLVELY